jgi:hypothetical protein
VDSVSPHPNKLKKNKAEIKRFEQFQGSVHGKFMSGMKLGMMCTRSVCRSRGQKIPPLRPRDSYKEARSQGETSEQQSRQLVIEAAQLS